METETSPFINKVIRGKEKVTKTSETSTPGEWRQPAEREPHGIWIVLLTRTSRRTFPRGRTFPVGGKGRPRRINPLATPSWRRGSSQYFPGPKSELSLSLELGKTGPAHAGPHPGGGAPAATPRAEAGTGAVPPLPVGVEHPCPPERIESPQSPTQAERGKGQYGRLHPLTLQVGARARVHQGLPRGLQGAGPEEVGPG